MGLLARDYPRLSRDFLGFSGNVIYGPLNKQFDPHLFPGQSPKIVYDFFVAPECVCFCPSEVENMTPEVQKKLGEKDARAKFATRQK